MQVRYPCTLSGGAGGGKQLSAGRERERVHGWRLTINGWRLTINGWRLNNCHTEMCSGAEAGSYSRLIDFVYLAVTIAGRSYGPFEQKAVLAFITFIGLPYTLHPEP